MNRLRTRLLFLFLLATLVPLAVTLALTGKLLEHSISRNPQRELESTASALQEAGRALYQTTCRTLRDEVDLGRRKPDAVYQERSLGKAPPEVREFAERGESRDCHLAGERRGRVEYLMRQRSRILVYSRAIEGPPMADLEQRLAEARESLQRSDTATLRRGYTITLIVIAAASWVLSFVAIWWLARRVSIPMEELTTGLRKLAAGDLDARLSPRGSDEVAAAMHAYNDTAEQLQQSRAKLIHVTRLASWQTLARKMAHEVKNSLTPIRLTVEEIVARRSDRDESFFEQAAQIVVEEVGTLERRVRAFTEFSAEPPVQLDDVDVNALFEERLALLRAAHPEVVCDARLTTEPLKAHVDPDLIKGVLTNLLDNAAHAAGRGGVVLGRTFAMDGKVGLEIHDSGPGLTSQARESLFEPTISFKKAGMGLGLSIAKRSALLVGGDLMLVDGELGGAAFRVLLPRSEGHAHAPGSGC